MDIKNKRVAVIGLGKSGFAAASLLKRQGAYVSVTDISLNDSVARLADALKSEGVAVETGCHTEAFIDKADLVVTSPGVPDLSKALIWARQKRIKIIDEIELGFLFCKAPIIAVTGANGKSTTVSLIEHIFKSAGREAVACGNIGRPFCGEVEKASCNSVVILEVSSFQLSRIDTFRPGISIFLNITDNHLDRHQDFTEYFNAKLGLFKNQKDQDWAILNCEDINILKIAGRIKAKKVFYSPEYENFQPSPPVNFASVYAERLFVEFDGHRHWVAGEKDLKIKGRHNVENALAAISAACVFGLAPEAIEKALGTFEGLEHRCEYVAVINGIRFINDSKSTTVDAAIKALNICSGKVIMIAGGRDKNADFSAIKGYAERKIKAFVLIGEAKAKLRVVLDGAKAAIKEADSLESAVETAYKLAKKGETVLLSPMCASFDQFTDFKHRGRVYKDAVKRLEVKCARRAL